MKLYILNFAFVHLLCSLCLPHFFSTGAGYSIRWSIVIYLTTSLLVNIKWIQGVIAFFVHKLRVFLILLFYLFQNRQYMHSKKRKIAVISDSLRPHGLDPARLPCSWDSLGKNTRVGCHALLQGIFPTQGSNPGLCIAGRFFSLSHHGSPRILEWVAYPFLQEFFPTQESNQGLQHCRWILYQLSWQGWFATNTIPLHSCFLTPCLPFWRQPQLYMP